ncbi:MAG: arylamine N-acetyltransferase [Clostridiales bacterium]|nr:arylamine N-acetyltransferase [Clostridiales bacterium]
MYTKRQIKEYLNRINYMGDMTVSKDTLDALVYAHQCGVPFENLDVYDFHREIPLDEDSLFEKIVTRRRGGYCFETNGLFCRVLQSVGFDARPCLCRVMFGLRYPRENLIDHRATIVFLDGQRYFCEAGIGGAMPPGALQLPPDVNISEPGEQWYPDIALSEAGEQKADIALPGTGKRQEPDEALSGAGEQQERDKALPGTDEQLRPKGTDCPEGCWQEMRGEYFCVRTIERNWYGTIRKVNVSQDIYDDPMNRRERLEIMFCDAAVHEIDFIAPNYFLSRSDQSMFRQKRVVNIRTPEGYRALTDNTYREVIRGRREERELAYPEIPIVLKEKFGIEISDNLREIM